ncbi:MAG: Hsp20/alpha crystallin family protein [Cryomorphaceae bacterium]
MKTIKMKIMEPTIRKQTSNGGYFPSMLDELFNELEWPTAAKTTVPAVNVKETESSYHLDVVAPGMSKEMFNVEVEKNTLTISSADWQEEVKEGEKYTRKEFSVQSFKRTFKLPENEVDVESIEGKYEQGILRITLPKLPEEMRKSSKRILIG